VPQNAPVPGSCPRRRAPYGPSGICWLLVVPARAPPPAPAPRSPLRLLLLVAAVAAASAAAGLLAGRRMASAPTAPGAASAPAEGAREGAPPPAAAQDGGESRPGAWTPAEMDAAAARLAASLAGVSCGQRLGRAVFVEADRAVASLACDPAEPARLTLSGGREFLARVLRSDRGLGLSALEVPGAAIAAVPLGAAAELGPGGEVAALVEDGREAKLRAMRAGALAAVLGVPVLRLEAGGRPLAGPVLDRDARLVALAPHDPIDPAHPDLAVPAEVLAGLFPGAEPPGPRWGEARARLEADDRRELEAFAAVPRGTELVAVRAAGDRTLEVRVMRRAAAPPAAEPLRATLAAGSEALPCRAAGTVGHWTSAAEALERTGPAPLDPALAARLRWAVARSAAGDLWLGDGELRLECDPGELPDGTGLRLDGAGGDAAPVALPREALLSERARAADSREEARRAADAEAERQQLEEARRRAEEDRRQADAESEAAWRAAFQQARDRSRQVEERRDRLERERSRAAGNYQFVEAEQLKQLRAAADVEFRQAEEDLAELERQASLAGVPRAWRR